MDGFVSVSFGAPVDYDIDYMPCVGWVGRRLYHMEYSYHPSHNISVYFVRVLLLLFYVFRFDFLVSMFVDSDFRILLCLVFSVVVVVVVVVGFVK